jgi:hypothetical protein
MKRIQKREPTVDLVLRDAIFHRPELVAIRRRNMFLREADAFELCAGKRIQCQYQAASTFKLLGIGH